MYKIIGRELRVCTFYKESKDGGSSSHSKYETLKVKDVISVISDYSGGWSRYVLLMEDDTQIDYFSPTGLS